MTAADDIAAVREAHRRTTYAASLDDPLVGSSDREFDAALDRLADRLAAAEAERDEALAANEKAKQFSYASHRQRAEAAEKERDEAQEAQARVEAQAARWEGLKFAAEVRAEAAEKERDEANEGWKRQAALTDKWANRAEAAEAREAALREALTPGVELIAAERKRQMDVEKWTPSHDDAHFPGHLAAAGAAYALNDEDHFPWPDWWNPGDDDVRRLAKAGALIAAELDRIARAALAASPEGE